MLKVVILDGYVDEPTCLGVPPYISPYPRYLAGAVWSYDKKAKVFYLTIDQIRTQRFFVEQFLNCDLLIVVAGMVVPGRYHVFPVSPCEISTIVLPWFKKPLKILCGPAAKHGFGVEGGKKTRNIENLFDAVIKGDDEVVIYDLLKNNLKLDQIDLKKKRKKSSDIREFAIKGSRVVKQHFYYPHYLIAEIETYRGCPRFITGGCSFCCEPLKGRPDYRPIKDVVDEVEALYQQGVRHFRVGNQPCIFTYMSKGSGVEEFPEPNPEAVDKLFRGIRRVAPGVKTLHIDNANPGVIARHPEKSLEVAKIIIKHHTPGDTAAFGVESVDPKVIKRNNLKADADQIIDAIKTINQVGARRGYNGMPELLPGLNFVFGLLGESKKTYEINYRFLKKIIDQNLLLRRVNIRQIMPLYGTKMYAEGDKIIRKHKKFFREFKKKVNEDVQRPLLKKILPLGTMVKDVFLEKHIGNTTFGRQIGSYPLLVGVPGVYGLKQFINVKVTGYGYRSITAVPYPLSINKVQRKTLQSIPGVGKKRAIRILAKRPFKNIKQIEEALDDKKISEKLLEYLTI